MTASVYVKGAPHRCWITPLLLGTVLLVGCGRASLRAAEGRGEPLGTDVVPSSVTVTGGPDFMLSRPGDRVTAFLGRSFPPSHWEGAYRAAQDAVDDCIEKAGGRPPTRPQVVWSDAAELQGTDLREFRRLYGYGVVDAYRTQADEDARAEATPTSLVDPELAAADALVAEHCASSGYDEIRDVLPPAELVQRYDALVMGAADDPDYLTASVRWLDCMSSVGYRSSVLGPYFAKGVVEEKIIAAQGVATGRHFVDYDSLQAAELLIFEADAECLASSGAGSVMLDLEQRILDTLRREFPNYTPVSQDPAGLAWMAR